VYSIKVKSVQPNVARLPNRKAEFIEPMECALVSTLPEGSEWTYEVKLDGYRAIGVKTSETILYSRNHKNFNKRFPQIAEALGDLPRPNRRLISNLRVTAA
jgi:ATP-dependent DNA ligase